MAEVCYVAAKARVAIENFGIAAIIAVNDLQTLTTLAIS